MRTRIGMALLALLAVGCSENENMSNPEIPVNAKPIQVGQRVQGVTRAVVTEGSSVTATVLMCDGAIADWSGFTAVKKNTITEGALEVRANVSTASFKAGTSAAVTLMPPLYYDHATNTTKSHLVAVAPDGIVGASGTVVTMKEVDGQQDVMYASAVDAGSETTPVDPINLTFNHLTTQLSFEIKITEATGTGEWDNKAVAVKNISVLSAQLPQSVDAADGAVSWSTPASLSVPNLTSVSLNDVFSKVGNPVMIKGKGTVKVDVTLAIGDADITITNVDIKDPNGSNLTTGIGESHLISLNVIEPSATTGGEVTVSAQATVTPWKEGASGSADVE